MISNHNSLFQDVLRKVCANVVSSVNSLPDKVEKHSSIFLVEHVSEYFDESLGEWVDGFLRPTHRSVFSFVAAVCRNLNA